MKTKNKIVAQAIDTYNQKGVANVTSRELAKQLGISHGNLEYHFPNKEALLLAIYRQMREEISAAYEGKKDGQEPFEAFDQLLQHLEVFQEKYRFFNLDFLEIARNYKQVGALLDETLLLRKRQLSAFFGQFRQSGYINENVDEKSYARLLHSVMALITFWKKQQAILPFKDAGQQAMAQHIWELLLPLMTDRGKEVYRRLVTLRG